MRRCDGEQRTDGEKNEDENLRNCEVAKKTGGGDFAPSHLRTFTSSGFLILEVMIASLILTAGVAATMYLFRLGFQYLERANDSNLVSSKIPQVINYMKVLDMDAKQGTEDMGDGVIMQWNAGLVDNVRPFYDSPDGKVQSYFNMYLYKVKIRLGSKKLSREYEMNILRSTAIEKNLAPAEF